MFTSKSLALALCGVAVCLFVTAESQAQSGAKPAGSASKPAGSDSKPAGSDSKPTSRSSEGSGTKTVKVTAPLSGNLSDVTMMQVFDANGDHVVSKKEVSSVLQLLTGLDADANGKITAAEMSEASIMGVAPRFEEAKKRAMEIKTSQDGSASKADGSASKADGSASKAAGSASK